MTRERPSSSSSEPCLATLPYTPSYMDTLPAESKLMGV